MHRIDLYPVALALSVLKLVECKLLFRYGYWTSYVASCGIIKCVQNIVCTLIANRLLYNPFCLFLSFAAHNACCRGGWMHLTSKWPAWFLLSPTQRPLWPKPKCQCTSGWLLGWKQIWNSHSTDRHRLGHPPSNSHNRERHHHCAKEKSPPSSEHGGVAVWSQLLKCVLPKTSELSCTQMFVYYCRMCTACCQVYSCQAIWSNHKKKTVPLPTFTQHTSDLCQLCTNWTCWDTFLFVNSSFSVFGVTLFLCHAPNVYSLSSHTVHCIYSSSLSVCLLCICNGSQSDEHNDEAGHLYMSSWTSTCLSLLYTCSSGGSMSKKKW